MKKLRLQILSFVLLVAAGCHSGAVVLPSSADLPPPPPSQEGGNSVQGSTGGLSGNSAPTPPPIPSPSPLPSGAVASSLDNQFFIGSVSEDSSSDLNFWRAYAANPNTTRQIAARYIYINGGFTGGWRTWGSADGDRAINYIRNSIAMGMMPFFVYYQIPGANGEGYALDLSNIQSSTYLRDYFLDLKFFLDIVKREGGTKEVGIDLEPDFIGYMMQLGHLRPAQISAAVQAAYASHVLDSSSDPAFPNTLAGLVQAINYTIRKYAPNARFGWEINLWASPGIHHEIPTSGLCRISDTLGIAAGKQAVRDEVKEIALYYKEAGILTNGAKWVFLDKYGLDGTGNYCSDPNHNPSACIWFWNSDHWNNYVTFIDELRIDLQFPVVLWQIPVGHLNNSTAINPATGRTFPPLGDVVRSHEDSAPDFIFGDSFQTSTTERFNYFGNVSDSKTTKSGNTITIGSHINELVQAGAVGVLFGAGVGISTDFDSDNNWWITKVQSYYRNPVRIP